MLFSVGSLMKNLFTTHSHIKNQQNVCVLRATLNIKEERLRRRTCTSSHKNDIPSAITDGVCQLSKLDYTGLIIDIHQYRTEMKSVIVTCDKLKLLPAKGCHTSVSGEFIFQQDSIKG